MSGSGASLAWSYAVKVARFKQVAGFESACLRDTASMFEGLLQVFRNTLHQLTEFCKFEVDWNELRICFFKTIEQIMFFQVE